MKRFFMVLCLMVCFLYLPDPPTALAEEAVYAVADSYSVYLYSEANEHSGLFLIPYTYYVKVIALGDPFCRVEYLEDVAPYQKVEGYCKRSELTFVDFVPARPYLKCEIQATYSLSQSSVPVLSDSLQTVQISYLFYGTYTVGSSLFYYVYGNGKFGYIPADEPLTYDLNTDYLTAASATDDPSAADAESTESISGMQIFFLCLLCVSIVAIAFFLLRGKKPPAREQDFP